MDDLTSKDSLELEVNDFGPIVHGRIDLRPLTVFVGPSNTGKSYLAILIYALHRFFSSRRWPGNWMFEDNGIRKVPSETIGVLVDWVKQTFPTDRKLLAEKTIVLPVSVLNVIRAGFDAQGDGLGDEIRRCFGIEKASALIRKGNRNGVQVIFRRAVQNESAAYVHRLSLKAMGTEFGTTMPEKSPIRINVGDAEEQIQYLYHIASEIHSAADQMDESSDFMVWQLTEFLVNLIQPHIASPLHLPAHYLPADRTGVMHAHSVVVSAMIGSAPMTGLRPTTDTPMLSGVLADFLQQLIQLDRPPHRRPRSRRDLGTRIEESILGGSVRVERSKTIDYPYFTYKPDGWKTPLPLMNASSMVSELAPVVLYLRYLVSPRSVLIIEEPESHLHPAMQVEFTRQIAALVKAGVRVIVTTHSEWVLEELANIVRRSELTAEGRKKMPHGEFALRPEQVGAWLFKRKLRPRGSVVEEVRLDEEIGLFPTDYDAVSEALYNDSVRIFNRIQDNKAE